MKATWDESRGGRDEPEGLTTLCCGIPAKGIVCE